MLYRIFTENKNKKNLCIIISEYFQGFTIFETVGYWQGKKEKSLCIEIVLDHVSDEIKVNRLCRSICGYNKQDCVLMQKLNIDSELIGISGKL